MFNGSANVRGYLSLAREWLPMQQGVGRGEPLGSAWAAPGGVGAAKATGRSSLTEREYMQNARSGFRGHDVERRKISRIPMGSFSRLVGSLVLGYLLLVLIVAGCQRSMIYYPSQDAEHTLRKEADRVGLEPWLDAEGKLIGWKTPAASKTDGTLSAIVFHGNAGHALHRTYFVDCFKGRGDREPWNVYIFEYPGYGAREGRPSERTIKAAAEAAVKPLVEGNGGENIFLVGESLGCGVACHLAGAYPASISGLLLITPFPSLVAVGQHHYPFLPVGILLRDRFENTGSLQNYDGPVAFVRAGQDRIIPPELGRALYDAYDGPKRLWTLDDRSHNTLDYHPAAQWWREVIEFLMREH